MALTRRVWSAGKFLLIAGALIATYVVFFAAAMRVAVKTRDVVVPDLRGRSANEVNELLADQGLAVRVEDATRIDASVPAGRVVGQEPAAGAITRSQRTVKVWLSAGTTLGRVPSLVGESERAAQLRVQAASLELAGIAEIRSADYAPDTVIAQQPPGDAPGAGVALLVNRGAAGRTFVMPDLIGVNGSRAAEILRGRGFRVAVVGDHPYPGVPPGVVLRQYPQAGFQVAFGDAISLEVSR
jgi:eukaryotic-like serine/threonine-protein kinase